MMFLKVKIIKYVSYDQPGFVQCKFNDIYGKEWEITEKVPVLTSGAFQEEKLPIEGFFVAGEVLSKENGVAIFCTKKPWYIASDDGETIFNVYENQLSCNPTK